MVKVVGSERADPHSQCLFRPTSLRSTPRYDRTGADLSPDPDHPHRHRGGAHAAADLPRCFRGGKYMQSLVMTLAKIGFMRRFFAGSQKRLVEKQNPELASVIAEARAPRPEPRPAAGAAGDLALHAGREGLRRLPRQRCATRGRCRRRRTASSAASSSACRARRSRAAAPRRRPASGAAESRAAPGE